MQNLADQMSLEGISSPVLVKVLASPQREKLELRNHRVPVSFIQQIMYYSKVIPTECGFDRAHQTFLLLS